MQNRNTPTSRLVAEVHADRPARIRRPQVVKQRFSRTPSEAYAQDGVDTTVTTRLVTWAEVALSDCAFGCKVYESSRGRREVQHNGAYGCPKAGERVLVDA